MKSYSICLSLKNKKKEKELMDMVNSVVFAGVRGLGGGGRGYRRIMKKAIKIF